MSTRSADVVQNGMARLASFLELVQEGNDRVEFIIKSNADDVFECVALTMPGARADLSGLMHQFGIDAAAFRDVGIPAEGDITRGLTLQDMVVGVINDRTTTMLYL